MILRQLNVCVQATPPCPKFRRACPTASFPPELLVGLASKKRRGKVCSTNLFCIPNKYRTVSPLIKIGISDSKRGPDFIQPQKIQKLKLIMKKLIRQQLM
jgi:hypothetical protein